MRVKFDIGNYPPLRVKIEETLSGASPLFVSLSHPQKHRPLRLTSVFLLPSLILLATSCAYDHYDNVGSDNAMLGVELNIRTRAITSDTQNYETGTQWENYIDIAGGDYRIYFFTNDKDDATATDDSGRNTLIGEFQPIEMTAVEGSDYTRYTLTGGVDDKIAEYTNFKIVVLANWGAYPTTIDDLVEGDNSTFTAATFLTTDGVSSAHLIPFYGVREYSDVKWRKGIRTPFPVT